MSKLNLDPIVEALGAVEAATSPMDCDIALLNALQAVFDVCIEHRTATRGTNANREAHALIGLVKESFLAGAASRTSDSPTAPSAVAQVPTSFAGGDPDDAYRHSSKVEGRDVVFKGGRVGTITRRFTRNIGGRTEVALAIDVGQGRKTTCLAKEVDIID